jgi:hypothetical protein
MRYLKIFEDFNNGNILLDVKDILLELEDIGFYTDVSYVSGFKISNPWTIEISKKSIFKWSDVSDVIERAKEVIENIGDWKASEYCVVYHQRSSVIKGTECFKNYDDFIDFVSDDGIYGIYEISFIFDLVNFTKRNSY